jgi:6-phosphogluconolactonase
MNNRDIVVFSSADSLAEWLVEFVKDEMTKSTSTNYSIALSGGSTPAKIFRYIASEKAREIDWEKVQLFWGDERCVSPDDEQSNYNMTRVNLLDHITIPEKNVFRVMGEYQPGKAMLHYRSVLDKNLQQKNGLPQFDLVLLGLGDDGHTASIFPGDELSLRTNDSCEVASHPETGQKRVSITMPVINNARMVVFLVTGAGKAAMVKNILGNAVFPEFPATHVNPSQGKLIWLLDHDAAKLLD